jgi:hypothetical protein
MPDRLVTRRMILRGWPSGALRRHPGVDRFDRPANPTRATVRLETSCNTSRQQDHTVRTGVLKDVPGWLRT